MEQKKAEFTAALSASLDDGSFVKLSLARYGGAEADLKTIQVRRITVKREDRLSFTFRYKTRDIVKNYDFKEAVARAGAALDDFKGATLMTTGFDLVYDGGRLKKLTATHKEPLPTTHDRAKTRVVEAEKSYLHDLQITDAAGNVLKGAQDKYRQINRYVEILAPLIATLPPERRERVVDMGSGKGYLTFALYDYLAHTLGGPARVTGVEYRADMVELCNRLAGKAGFGGLDFAQGTIAGYDAAGTDILVALHACDTATDDAIIKGIEADAALIVVAPCCHKQIRRAMESGGMAHGGDFLLRHGIFRERQAEMVTDGIRALILEYFGYATKVFEFISDSHTPKNVMITALRDPKTRPRDPAIAEKIQAAKAQFGIDSHYLEKIIGA